MSELQIRHAHPADLERLVDILEVVAAEDRYVAFELPIDRADRIHRWRELLIGHNSTMFVVCDQGVPVGEIVIGEHAEYGPILGMMVAPEYRSRGAGSLLMEAGLAWAAQCDAEHLCLLVFAHNAPAIRFYEKFKFVQVDYFEQDVVRKSGEIWDTILMRRELRKP